MIKLIFRHVLRSLDYEVARRKPIRRPSEFPLESIKYLKQVTDILKRHGCDYWLTSGTLLGAIRNGDFIEYDTDIDLAVKFSNFTKECYYELAAKFNVISQLGFPEDSLEIALEKNGIKIDLFFIYESGNEMRHAVFFDFRNGSYSRADYIYPRMRTVPHIFLNTEFLIPEKYINYLECNYGPDWRKPKKNWDYSNSPPHIRRVEKRTIDCIARGAFSEWIN